MAIYYNIRCLSDDSSMIKEISNPTKTLKCLAFPRKCLKDFSHMGEATQAGVYLLYNTADKNEQPHIYIGQTGYNVMSRLNSHDRNKDFWDYALVFVEKGDFLNLTGTHAKIIESLILDKAKKCGVVVMDNSTGSNPPRTRDEDRFAAATWSEEIISITRLLGLAFFEENRGTAGGAGEQIEIEPVERKIFYCKVTKGRTCSASGYPTDNGFLVQKGSIIAKEKAKSFRLDTLLSKLEQESIIRKEVFQRDYEFGSPSTAGAFVLGRAADGYYVWKDSENITLHDVLGRGKKNG